MLHSIRMMAARGRLALPAAGLLLLFLIICGWAILASGLLVPPPSIGPVAIDASVRPAHTASAVPSGAPSPSPSQSPGASRGIVATRIVIPKLGIDLPIYEGDGYTAQIGKAAHYPTTSWPGSGSLTYLYAHARDNNFIALWDAKVGDLIQLKLANGSTAQYRVSRIDRNVPWNDLALLDPTAGELLRLQTCNSSEETAPRFVVEATPAHG